MADQLPTIGGDSGPVEAIPVVLFNVDGTPGGAGGGGSVGSVDAFGSLKTALYDSFGNPISYADVGAKLDLIHADVDGVEAALAALHTDNVDIETAIAATNTKLDTLHADLATSGHSAIATFARTADVNPYLASDVIGAAPGSTAALTFASMGKSGGEIMITSVSIELDVATSAVGQLLLYLYSVTPPSALGDNVPWDLPSGDRASFLGYIDLGVPVDLGSTLYKQNDSVNKQVKLAGTGLFAYLVTAVGYVPTSGAVKTITLHSVDL